MEKVFSFINQWKTWILRALVGAVIAIILGYAAGMHVWLVGAIIAVVSELIVGRLLKPFTDLLGKAESKVAKSADVAEEVKDTAKKAAKK